MRLDEGLGVCRDCENSPLCDRCGHPRGDHVRVFHKRGAAGCDWDVFDFPTMTSEPCACAGFRPVTTPLSEATFAQPEPDEVDPLELGLRLADA